MVEYHIILYFTCCSYKFSRISCMPGRTESISVSELKNDKKEYHSRINCKEIYSNYYSSRFFSMSRSRREKFGI